MTTLQTIVGGAQAGTAGRVVRALALSAIAVAALGGLGGCKNQAQIDEQNRLAAENAQLKEQLATTAQSQTAMQSQIEQLQRDLAARQAAPQPGPAGSDTGMGGRPTPRGDTVISVAGDVAFSSGQAELTAAGRRELDSIANRLNGQYAGNRIRIEGYTDKHPIRRSKWGSNEALSLARAQAVERYLAGKGVSSGRMESIGMGSSKLKATDAASRRVEIVILGG